MQDFEQLMQERHGDKFRKQEPMNKHTTWRVGGQAEYFVETSLTSELIETLDLAHKYHVGVFMLGGGSNVLIADKGINGLVIKHLAREYEIVGDLHGTPEQITGYRRMVAAWEDHTATFARHNAVHYHFYDERNPNVSADSVFIRLSSGYTMSAFIEKMFQNGVTGLERFARIPGTFGGWIYNNVHAHTQFIGEFVHTITYIDHNNYPHDVSWQAMDFMYNHSRFHGTRHVILNGVIRLYRGDVELARSIYKDVLAEKLDKQPGNTAGSVFHNFTSEEAAKHNFESVSVGYVVDKILGWKGTKRVGGAWISEKNGNFIETNEEATAADVLALVEEVKNEFRARFQINLQEEFFRVGDF